MNIQIASDLHLEFGVNYNHLVVDASLKPVGDILLLAGDIFTYQNKDRFQRFLDLYGPKFEKVIVIGGNHEWYGSNWGQGDIPKTEGNLVYLNNETYEYNGVRFIGSTMWSGSSAESAKYLNDYYRIVGFTVGEENMTHRDSKDFIIQELEKPFDGKTVVMTHHLPTMDCIDPAFADSPMNDCFASDQSRVIESFEIDAWVHGHSHSFQDFTIHDTRVIRNPLGYEHEWNDWKPDFTIEM